MKKFLGRWGWAMACFAAFVMLVIVPLWLRWHKEAILRAAAKGNAQEVRRLIETGADVNTQDREGWTALHHACGSIEYAGHGVRAAWVRGGPEYVETVRVLLEAGANPNAQDMYDRSPLHLAAQFLKIDETRLLLEHGANPNSQGNGNEPPLLRVIGVSHAKSPVVARLLLEHGADPNAIVNGETLLDWCMSEEVAAVLREYGAKTTEELRGEEKAGEGF